MDNIRIQEIELFAEHENKTSNTLICYGFRDGIPDRYNCDPMLYAFSQCLQQYDGYNFELIKIKMKLFQGTALKITNGRNDESLLSELKVKLQSKFQHVAFQIKHDNILYDKHEYFLSSEDIDADQEYENDDYFNHNPFEQRIKRKRFKKDKETLKMERIKRKQMKETQIKSEIVKIL